MIMCDTDDTIIFISPSGSNKNSGKKINQLFGNILHGFVVTKERKLILSL